MRQLFALAFTLLMLATPAAANTPPHLLYTSDSLNIITKYGDVKLSVEVARTPAQMENGLMFRTSLPEKAGMIFLFLKKQPIEMWMKNTLIPLDMLFIDEHGKIIWIARNTVPESTDRIPSHGEITAVIEIAGGSAARLQIAKGDKVVYRHFHE